MKTVKEKPWLLALLFVINMATAVCFFKWGDLMIEKIDLTILGAGGILFSLFSPGIYFDGKTAEIRNQNFKPAVIATGFSNPILLMPGLITLFVWGVYHLLKPFLPKTGKRNNHLPVL